MEGIIFLLIAFAVLSGISKLIKQAGDQKPGPTVRPEQPPDGREQQLPLRSEMPQQPQQQQWQRQQPPQPVPVPRQQVPSRSRVPQPPQPVPQQQVPPRRTVVVQQQRQAPAAAAPDSRSRTAVEQRVWQALPPEVRGYLERVAAQQQGVQQPMRTAPLPTPAARPRPAATAARPPAVRQQVRPRERPREKPRQVLSGIPFEDMNDVRRAIVVSEILRRPRVFRMYPQR